LPTADEGGTEFFARIFDLLNKSICHHGQKTQTDKIEIQSITGLTKKYNYDKM
jgi:hypothetical protein